ncbi:MAG: prepilin-type N-terminal cleavage/methylation domain-containing protein [Gammaproteobacteria bacterium]|nr:MAG: prepilin-type N-terminal cleavage/methylation domain-containing protein [Gammaproteobacteria bacterium]
MSYIAGEGSRRPGARRARGFTLIEIMVVVIIIGLLAAVIVPTVLSKVDDARVAKAKQDIQSLEAALSMYYGYLERVSKDPWGNPYLYVFPGTHGKTYDLYTLGADGQPGGDGINADIGNWNLGD